MKCQYWSKSMIVGATIRFFSANQQLQKRKITKEIQQFEILNFMAVVVAQR